MAKSGTVVAFKNARQIEAMAATVRRVLGVKPGARISMQPILEHALDLIFEDGHFEIEEDYKMGGAEARTAYHEPLITISNTTYNRLCASDPRARMTIAHEIGHLILHCLRPVAMHRSVHYDPRHDPEWQADMFAAALLMPRNAFLKTKSIREAMEAFGVSRSAAIQRAQRLHHEFQQPEPRKGQKKATPKRRP